MLQTAADVARCGALGGALPHSGAAQRPLLPATERRLFSKIDGEWRTVPAEARPLDRNKQPRWPPGWHRQRRVESERDIFELVGLPYREPSQRDA